MFYIHMCQGTDIRETNDSEERSVSSNNIPRKRYEVADKLSDGVYWRCIIRDHRLMVHTGDYASSLIVTETMYAHWSDRSGRRLKLLIGAWALLRHHLSCQFRVLRCR